MNGLYKVIERIDEKYGKYVSIGSGWEKIVVDCNEELSKIDPNYKILQVKEKFGDLRFYFEPSDKSNEDLRKKMNDVVAKHELLASATCEETGLPGIKMRSAGGWIKTLNPEYAEKNHHYAKYERI
jgi:hypothetical protein